MKSDQLGFRPGFRLSAAIAKSQAAVMVLAVVLMYEKSTPQVSGGTEHPCALS